MSYPTRHLAGPVVVPVCDGVPMTERIAAEARRLRTEEGLSAQQIQHRLGVSKLRLYEWLRGVPPPEWTRRPNAKDDLRKRALGLRSDGWSVNDIALELGVAKSTAYQWVRHLPLDRDAERARRKREHAKLMTEAQWAARRQARVAEQAAERAAAAETVGRLSDREVLLLGAVAYWCEGSKGKPWRPLYLPTFTNSDPVLVQLYLAFVETLGIPRAALRYRISIHESADAGLATEWWAKQIGVAASCFQRPTLKRHNPRTTRLNTGEAYRGCLVVVMPRGRTQYWRIEGIMQGIAHALAGEKLG